MPESIFYQPKNSRHEDALSFGFLAFLERIGPAIRVELANRLGWSKDKLDWSAVAVEFHPFLAGPVRSTPDGLVKIGTMRIGFENKVNIKHNVEQLQRYYDQLAVKYGTEQVRILVATDADVQNLRNLEKVIESTGRPSQRFILFSWQSVYHVCSEILEQAEAKTVEATEVEVFLLRELIELLKVMEMVSYEGMTASDLQCLLKALTALRALDEYLRRRVPELIPFVESFPVNSSYASLLDEMIGFGFRNAEGVASNKESYLALQLVDEDSSLEISITIGLTEQLRSVLNNMDLDRFKDFLASLTGYNLFFYGDGRRMPIDIETLGPRRIEPDTLYLEVAKRIPFHLLESKYQLASPDFVRHLSDEIALLGPLAEIVDSALAGPRSRRKKK